MLEQRKEIRRLVSMNSFIDRYQNHPTMVRVNQLKNKLKQEKLQDKAFYQSIKEKIATSQS